VTAVAVANEDRPPIAVLRAMRHAAVHDAVEGVRQLASDAAGSTIEVIIRTELPAAWRAAGESPFGVRAREAVTIRFPPSYPLASPQVELRADFNRSHPHINPSRPGQPVRPCLVAGSVRELVQARGFFGLIEQLASWLDKASTLSLNDPAEGWEPVRRDAIDDIVAADTAALRAVATAVGGAQFRDVTYVVTADGFHRLVLEREPVTLSWDAARLFKRQGHDGFACGTGLAIVAWAGRRGGAPILADNYMPETVSTVSDLLDRAEAYGCREALQAKLSWAAGRIDLHPPTHPIPVAVLLLARRPRNVIGTDSPIEVCPYLIEASAGADLTNPSRPIRIAGLRDQLSVPVLRRAAGMDPDASRPVWTLVGCGSVGSKLALHLARAGLAPGGMIDQDWFEPHNYARHAGIPNGEVEALFFRPKVDEVARQMIALGQRPIAMARADVVGLAREPAQRAKLVREGTRAVIDTTGSAVVREALSHMPKVDNCRGIEACLMGAGTVGYLSLEGPGGNPSASDLVVEAYHEIAAEKALAERVFGSEAEAVTIGQGCSAVTFAMPDGRLSALTASMATPIARWLGSDMPDGGELRLGRLRADGLSQEWSVAVVPPWTVVEGCGGRTVARLHPRVHAAIQEDVERWRGVETGGVLIGRYAEAGELFQIVDLLPAPEDSTRTPELFTLGTRGLKRAIREVVSGSGGALQAVGTWHSHLAPSGPSMVDIASGALLAVRQLAPLLMLIWTPAGYTHLVAEATADGGGSREEN
jgi:hypothetical protein